MIRKKYQIGDEKVVRDIVNYMLREFDISFNQVQKQPLVNGVQWNKYYWDTPKSKEQFKDWLGKYLKSNTNLEESEIPRAVQVIDSVYGLKVIDK